MSSGESIESLITTFKQQVREGGRVREEKVEFGVGGGGIELDASSFGDILSALDDALVEGVSKGREKKLGEEKGEEEDGVGAMQKLERTRDEDIEVVTSAKVEGKKGEEKKEEGGAGEGENGDLTGLVRLLRTQIRESDWLERNPPVGESIFLEGGGEARKEEGAGVR
mmetsp:Transcript_18985/g.48416  ORF Transcript_18985/g.48416 Transcript_18985/m.48416 type:complete len:168 (-) Transcript_18985:2859-3362(-)